MLPGRLWRHPWARGATLVLALFGIGCVLAPLVAPYDQEEGSLSSVLQRPGPAHWLGTDELGRDVLSRLLWGGRASLAVAALVTLIAPTVGTAYGLAASAAPPFAGGPAMRLVDGLLGLPRLPIYLVLLTLLTSGFWAVVAVMAAFEWPVFARLTYLDALSQKRTPHVEAVRALGAGATRITLRHILPNLAGPLIVTAALGVRTRILAETSLSYLGFGILPPTPSWGNMLAAAQSHIWDDPALAVYPGLAIFIVSVAATLLGDALRDALDPSTAAQPR